MIKDKMVRVKLRKHFHEQRPMLFVGKVTGFSENWVILHAKGLMLSRSQPNGVQIDAKPSAMLIPRDNIDSIRVLPDSFDLETIKITTDGQQIRMVVESAQDALLGEMGEG
jgi:hypothetical protein